MEMEQFASSREESKDLGRSQAFTTALDAVRREEARKLEKQVGGS